MRARTLIAPQAPRATPPWQRRLTSIGRLRRGTAAVEFVIVLPLLITVLLGVSDFGRFSYSAIALANCARSGAGYAMMQPNNSGNPTAWQAAVRQAAVDELSQSTVFDTSKLTIAATSTADSDGLRRVSVTAAYPFETLVTWPHVPHSLYLKHTIVMRGIR